MRITVCDISGAKDQRHAGGYEWGCQVACARALRFLQRLKDEPLPVYKQYQNVTGLVIGEGPVAEAMDAYILDHPMLREYGLTGAMHQYALNHATKLYEVGRAEYLRLMKECRPDADFYEFEESDAFPEGGSA